jgi:glutamate synthase (NADPH/NADH) large chain
VRETLAAMGYRKLDDIIGQSELLAKDDMIEHWKAKGLDFSRVFYKPEAPKEADLLDRTAGPPDCRRAGSVA